METMAAVPKLMRYCQYIGEVRTLCKCHSPLQTEESKLFVRETEYAKNHQIIVWTDRLSENCVKPVETSWAKVAIYQNMWAKPSERRAMLTSTSYLVKRSINMLGDHHDSWTNVRVGRGGHSSRTKASWGWSRVGHMLDYPSLLAYSSAYTLSQSAGIHEDVFTQWVGISCGKRHRNTGGEGHLEENKKQLRIFS